jgi:hypothetical protein
LITVDSLQGSVRSFRTSLDNASPTCSRAWIAIAHRGGRDRHGRPMGLSGMAGWWQAWEGQRSGASSLLHPGGPSIGGLAALRYGHDGELRIGTARARRRHDRRLHAVRQMRRSLPGD